MQNYSNDLIVRRLQVDPSAVSGVRQRSFSDRSALILGLSFQVFLLLSCIAFSNSSVVETAATYIYADGQVDYLSGVFLGLILTLTIFFWPINRHEKLIVFLLWQAKLVVCLVLMLFYEAYFVELDAFGYFNSAAGQPVFFGFAIGDGTTNVIELCKLLLSVLPDSYHLLKVAFAYVGLVAIVIFYRVFCLAAGSSNRVWLVGLGLFPSILFWSSILGKDSISLLGIAIACMGMTLMPKGKIWLGFFWLAIGILLVAYIRIWLALILLAPAMVIVMTGVKSKLIRIALIIFAFGIAVGLVTVFNERFEIESRRDALERYDSLSRNWSDVGGSSQVIEVNLTDPLQLLAFTPLAAFTALFRPLPFEILSVFGTLSGLENMLLLALFLRAIVRFKATFLRKRELLAGMAFLLVWVILYGPISYQNLGTAVRFKLQILPVLLGLFIVIGTKNKAPITLIAPSNHNLNRVTKLR